MKASALILSVAAALTTAACVVPYDYDHHHERERHHERGYDRDDHYDRDRYDHDRRRERRDERSKERRERNIRAARFECRNGLYVNVRPLGSDRIELRLDDKRSVLNIARSGSGSLYTSSRGLFGNRTEWHQKDGSAIFNFTDPYGNRVETTCAAL
ncbi:MULTISPECIES: MliC family protein [unclassified Neisseria]|uniref:MliC family protein n=1 Tax=unclassified Neisseria TaxID=2623750 RepID=UPI002666EBB6|nr:MULTISPECIES: MliC family protein [unclassified Neisseria]MDO1510322.1 MliC family protein [Neisseria sp. MVDL19-042950]MDO1516491.1 MliC family protein [Neisseria sp. MVDL18-041461]MDO1563716.1 MliC family protein [Neisseria sp. MVDL20-010259]